MGAGGGGSRTPSQHPNKPLHTYLDICVRTEHWVDALAQACLLPHLPRATLTPVQGLVWNTFLSYVTSQAAPEEGSDDGR